VQPDQPSAPLLPAQAVDAALQQACLIASIPEFVAELAVGKRPFKLVDQECHRSE